MLCYFSPKWVVLTFFSFSCFGRWGVQVFSDMVHLVLYRLSNVSLCLYRVWFRIYLANISWQDEWSRKSSDLLVYRIHSTLTDRIGDSSFNIAPYKELHQFSDVPIVSCTTLLCLSLSVFLTTFTASLYGHQSFLFLTVTFTILPFSQNRYYLSSTLSSNPSSHKNFHPFDSLSQHN